MTDEAPRVGKGPSRETGRLGWSSPIPPCPACDGLGYVEVEDLGTYRWRCTTCDGTGQAPSVRILREVHVHALSLISHPLPHCELHFTEKRQCPCLCHDAHGGPWHPGERCVCNGGTGMDA